MFLKWLELSFYISLLVPILFVIHFFSFSFQEHWQYIKKNISNFLYIALISLVGFLLMLIFDHHSAISFITLYKKLFYIAFYNISTLLKIPLDLVPIILASIFIIGTIILIICHYFGRKTLVAIMSVLSLASIFFLRMNNKSPIASIVILYTALKSYWND